MMDYHRLAGRSSYEDKLKLLEADIQHANLLASSIPSVKGSACLQMKLVYNPFAPIFLLFLQWMDCSCTCLFPSYLNLFHIVVYKVCPDGKPLLSSYRRKATIREFYAVIFPSLQRLQSNPSELDIDKDKCHGLDSIVTKGLEKKRKHPDVDLEREDECGICLEPCTKMVLPNCCHAMCINCYHDWNTRSESCPFCRGSLKRVNSGDLWVLTHGGDVADAETVSKEEMLRFYLYMNRLPKDVPDALFLVYYEYLM
ncbi:E3 ubiquitin-protein ligase AIRP2-like [Cornus florida]|uniref:E3 ubiquitin-protein ligase AIRP2-like n=1 Tax=Cornus florida TaxID=4283 RepID=UPI0028A066A9|nr:E3 ubiquitin-protein ligase AIRP2-like [Cornus florida]